jgi:glycolate oxidase
MSLSAQWWSRARDIAGDRVISDPEAREPYGHDEFATDEFRLTPEAVVKPANEGEVAALLALCSAEKVPVTVRGGGTGLAAGCVPSPGGIVLSMELLNKLLDADPANLAITVQAGMPLRTLYEEVQKMSLYFPPHPGDEGAFVGGAVAANAGGARAVKYGTVRRFVLGLQVVMASGEVLELGGKYIKSSTGYHLADLMIGSEGTLGVITRVTLALLPPVGSVQTLIAPFPTVGQAIAAVPAMLAAGIIPCAVEFVEHSAIRCAERMLNASWPAREGTASLMIILDGRSADDTLAQAEAVGEKAEQAGALEVLLTDQKSRQAEILALRSMLYEAIRPKTIEGYDVCVPRSEIVDHVAFVHELEGRVGLPIPTYGHAADGNVHSHTLRAPLADGLFGEEIPDWREKNVLVKKALYADVAVRRGVISGEHGIGLAKRAYLSANLGPAHVAAMRAIKKALDPDGILNPGKIFDP